MKKILFLFLSVIFLSCSGKKDRTAHLLEFVPEQTFAIAKSNNLQMFRSDLQNSNFLKQFSKTEPFTFVSDKVVFLEHLNPVSEVLLFFSEKNDSTYHHTLTTRYHSALFETDSIAGISIEEIGNELFSIKKVSIENQSAYMAVADEVFILSSSLESLESVLISQKKAKKITALSLEKVYSTSGNDKLTLYIHGKRFPNVFKGVFEEALPTLSNFTSWMVVDADVFPDEIKMSGITLAQDSVPQLLDVFRGTLPQKNEIATVVPVAATGFISLTYNDYEILKANLVPFQEINDSLPTYEAFFKSLNEVGVIFTPSERVVAIHAIDGNITSETLSPYEETLREFRGVTIRKISDTSLFERAFYPILPHTDVTYFVKLDEFFVFSKTENALEEIIVAYINETTLGFRPYFKSHFESMSDRSSLLLVSFNENIKKEIPALRAANFSKLPMAAFQLVYDNHYAHINAVVKEASLGSRSTGVSQLMSIALENELLQAPQFFTNHLTKGKDIVVQDVSNKLYLIAASGRVQWTRQLDGPVLGEIQEVDAFKNGRIQMAFTTEKTLYMLDRNGNDVAPFPLKFRDPVTQPLAVFDYDNNRNYRLLVTQGKELLMYDAKGKIVSGFTFKKAGSKVVFPPQHIRIGNRDYILVAEESGKLNILNRTGAERISVSKRFSFGNQPIVLENDGFAFYTATGTKEFIDQGGKVTSEVKPSSADSHLVVRGRTRVALEEHILNINNKRIELPFGLYAKPVISISNQRVLISVTDLQQNRVYTYNSQAELLPNFPVYGTSVMEFGDANNNGRPNGVVKGDSKNVVLYEIN